MSYRIILCGLLAGIVLPACTGSKIDSVTHYSAEIIRDDYGIPHIYGKTDADAVYGMIYAQAEDDFPRVERNYVWATGRLAEVQGEAALFSDLRARLYMSVDEAKAAYDGAPAKLRSLCDAWAAGLNDYLTDHPDVTPELLTRFEPWMPMFFSEGSIGGDIEQIPLAGIKAFYGGEIPSPALTADAKKQLVDLEEPKGSNGIALSGKLTQSGDAMLLINPHTSFYFRPEIHVNSEEGLNAYGAVTWGQFFVYQGFSEYNGWMHTSTYVDFIDEFEESALQQSFQRTKTKNHREFREMMDIRTNSSNNTVYADKDGTIAYYHGNFVPKRDTQFDYSKPVDGSDPRTDWTGVHKVEEVITITNPPNGWIQNANSTPFTAAGDNSPKRENYPAYMAPDKENFRGVHAVRLLEKAENMTVERLIDLGYDPALPAFEVIIPSLREAYEGSNKNPNMAAEIDILANWDFKTSSESTAMTLAHAYGMEILRNAKRPRARMSRMELLTHMATEASAGEQLTLFAAALQNLRDDYGKTILEWGEVNRFQRLTGDIVQPHDDAVPSVPVGMASGRWGALAAYGARQANGSKKLYGYRGNSFVAVVEFGDKVKAKTLLAGGQSGDPSSPHFTDQVEDYIAGRFKDVPYYKEDVEARAVEQYSVTTR